MKLKFIKKEEIAKDTKAFFFQSENNVNYLPGQFFYFTIPQHFFEKVDPKGPTRHFTLFLSPTEEKIIAFATRMRKESIYKNTLDKLKPNDIIEGYGPEGTFILDESEKGPHILLAGGIGITPFRSMIKYAIDKNLNEEIYLIYSNSTPEEAAFKDELLRWTNTYKNIKVYLTITKPEESKERWNGFTGRIDEKLIKSLIDASILNKGTFWISGPPAMVDAIEETLISLNIPLGKVRTEKFTGY